MKTLDHLIDDGKAEDIFQSDAASYPLTQQWGAWLRSKYPDAAGLRWMSRQHNLSVCYVFFDDVCTGLQLKPIEASESLEPGTRAFELLEHCVEALDWEVQW